MTREQLFQLKNGTDVRGTAIAGVKDDPVTLTDEAVTLIAKAFYVWAAKRSGKAQPVIAVGHDFMIIVVPRKDRLVWVSGF